jgi:hypothetical protein
MTIISLQITAMVEFDFRPENYPAGFTAHQALALELEQAACTPHEYVTLPKAAISVQGRLLGDDGQPLLPRSLDGWGQHAAREIGFDDLR